MPVLGQTPTEGHFNATLPAAPAGSVNVVFQASAPYPDPNNPVLQVRDISAYVAAGGGASSVHSESLTDGQGNFIFAGGDIVTVVGVPN